jgi:hypothetical protein
MATLPTSPKPRRARVERISAVAATQSPFSFQQQVHVHAGKAWKITLEYPPVKEASVASWHQFFYDCNGMEGTFTFDLTTYVKSTPAPGTLTFRLVSNQQGWDIERARLYGFVVEALQVVS